MKHQLISAWLLVGQLALAGSLPVITSNPQNKTISPGSSASFSVGATGATSYQWRFNGTNIAGASGSVLQLPSAYVTDAGYYTAVARNENGWVPSQMAYLAVSGATGGGTVPLSNQGNSSAIADYQVGNAWGQPITNGTARVVAGPALDQMQPVGASTAVVNGYFNATPKTVPSVAPGQTVYYRVDITYPYFGGSFTQSSTVLQLVAGGGGYPTPSAAALKFPLWPEWPEPWYQSSYSSPTNLVCLPGTSLTLTNYFMGYSDFGIPTLQWRKDGRSITSPMSFTGSWPTYYSSTNVLTLSSLQPADAGIYDAVVLGNNWLTGPKISLSIQFTNGPGVLRYPRVSDTNFLCDLQGVVSLTYAIQWSTNLSAWNSLCTLSNATGTITFTNGLAPEGRRFYRALLSP